MVVFEVLLLPKFIRLLYEGAQFLIQVFRLPKPEMMDVVMPRDGVDAHEARSFVPVRQNQMTNYSGALDPEGGKRHADLNSDPGLLRQDDHLSATPDLGYEKLIELADGCGLAPEV